MTCSKKCKGLVVPRVRRTISHQEPIDLDSIDPCVCVIGVGFVGEALLREFGQAFTSIGFDISRRRIEELEKVFSPFPKVTLTTDETRLREATHYLISVPTPLKKDRSINPAYLISAIRTTLSYARPGSAIILESSVSVGSTRQFLYPYKDTYHCGMSPERVDPGRTVPPPASIPKLVSALTPKSLSLIQKLYSQAFTTVIPVSSPETAELTKLFENCHRMINIAYVNEMADAARAHGVDPEEMVAAASSKPYGFTTYKPGLGVGGTCIPVNPFYLFANSARLPVLQEATSQMRKRPGRKARVFYQRVKKMIRGKPPRVLVVGIGYKVGQGGLACSPGLEFAEMLRRMGCSELMYYDPLVEKGAVEWMEALDDEEWEVKHLEGSFDAIAICMRQKGVDFGVLEKSKIIVQEVG